MQSYINRNDKMFLFKLLSSFLFKILVAVLCQIIHMCTHQDSVGVFSAESERDTIDAESDCLCVGHPFVVAPVFILQSHIKWLQSRLFRAQCYQLIDTCALEVESATIQTTEVGVT